MRAVLFAFLVLIPLAAGACTQGGADTKATHAASQTGGAATSMATITTATPQTDTFVRTCATNVYGKLGPRGWRRHSIIAGPLAFWYADEYATARASMFAPAPGSSDRYRGLKLLVLVRPDAVATVIVPESERGAAALLYNPANWNHPKGYRIEDGDSAVTFEACKKGETIGTSSPLNEMTQFNGAFLVAGVRCVPLEVFVQGRQETIPVTLSFGAGRCPR
jgi:hypothetical protein